MAIQGTAKTQPQFDIFMQSHSMHIPGNTVTINLVDKFLGNVMPAHPNCADCRDQTLARLPYICEFRDDGLSHGRYTGQNGPVIRTFDVKYNNIMMKNYAIKSLNASIRGRKLNDSTPLAHMNHRKMNTAHFTVAIDALKKVK